MRKGTGAPRSTGRDAPPIRLLGLIAAALLAGCSSAHHDPTGSAELVPWDGTLPAPLRPTTATPAPPCRASQLTVVGNGFQFDPAISGGTGQVTLRTVGSSACGLSGRPDVQIVGAAPAPPQRQTSVPAQPPSFPAVVAPDSVLLSAPPGTSVRLDVDWRNWCIPVGSANPVPPRAIRLTLPEGAGSLDVGYNAVPPCDTPAAATTIGVRPFQAAPLPPSTPWTTSAVQATIEPLPGDSAHLTAKRGDVLRFAVKLRNPSPTPISFAACPLVIEMLAPTGHPEVHQLNCRAAGALPAGGALRFEMRIQIPVDAPAGNNGLFWELDPTGARGPETTSGVVVADR